MLSGRGGEGKSFSHALRRFPTPPCELDEEVSAPGVAAVDLHRLVGVQRPQQPIVARDIRTDR